MHESQPSVPPEHSGDPFAAARQRMVDYQLRRRGIRDPRVLWAMASVPREEFAPADRRDEAYDDGPLPIGFGQTISQPYTVAFMCEALQLRGGERVLEIGTGSGYGAAVLSLLAGEVYTVERIAELADEARRLLQRLGYSNVHVCIGDGTLGWPPGAPYDAIVVTAGGSGLPEAYLQQLADGGRIVIPLGSMPYSQNLYRFVRSGGELRVEDLGAFAFVPLVGQHGWSNDDAADAPEAR
jgi:protein-L-isoaspartate(D-aspartate) O-methyltransferase